MGTRLADETPEELLDDVTETRDQLREAARQRLGVTGVASSTPLAEVLRSSGVSAYPLIALGLLSIVDSFHSYAFTVLTPEISTALGIGKGAIAGIVALKTLALALAPLPFAAATQGNARRALLCIGTAVLWSLVAIGTGFVTVLWGLVAVLVLDGLTTATTRVLHPPLLMDTYPPEGRVRAVSFYQGFDSLGNLLAPLLVALLTGAMSFTWRGVFVLFGIISLAVTAFGARLRDPGYGRWDTDQMRDAVRSRHAADEAAGPAGQLDEREVRLGFFEIVQRLLLVPSIKRLLTAYSVLGVLLVPYVTFLSFFLDERWNLGPGARGLFTAGQSFVAILALVVFGRAAEARFRESPSRVVEMAGVALLAAVLVIALAALSPTLGLTLALFAAGAALIAVVTPALHVAVLSIVPASMRSHTVALLGLSAGAGGLAGALLLAGIERRFGVGGSIISMVIPGVLAALVLFATGRLVPKDLDRMIDEVIEEEEIRQIVHSGGHLPMLACRNLDFSYGQLQVLFGVDFSVDDGEMVALLGVNGSGKSTLLKCISGIGLVSAGSIRYRGTDITYLDAERRLGLGIAQVPGGRAVFGPMTVVENLRSYGFTLGRDRAALDGAIDRCFDAFPRLGERRNQHAATLSGGEQQMLALSKALILRPPLLLIDELSLGLAPAVVGQLLEMVRQINADGTAVVLVEQSVNIALGLVDHAYFMEKGEVRFDGPSHELLERDDLIRAVFLEGVASQAVRT
jgi:ABC-type branched-subunit amino acid transport system ATPase component/sugar phosphate permease